MADRIEKLATNRGAFLNHPDHFNYVVQKSKEGFKYHRASIEYMEKIVKNVIFDSEEEYLIHNWELFADFIAELNYLKDKREKIVFHVPPPKPN